MGKTIFTLVTGCDSKYFNYMLRSLNNIFELVNKNNDDNLIINVILYDLGLTTKQVENIKEKYKKIIYNKFDFNKYPEHVSLEKYNGINCSYAWKPIIFDEVCRKYKNLVLWFDARSFYYNFHNIIKTIKKEGIYCAASNHNIETWNHPKTLDFMKGCIYKKNTSRAAGTISVNYNLEWIQNLVSDWKKYSLIKECIIPEGSDRNNHRQDQAVLEILYYRYQEIYKFNIIDNYIDFEVQKSL